MRTLAATCLLVAAGATASAQDLVFEATLFDNSGVGGTSADPYYDIFSFTSATTAFRIGNNLTAIAYDGTNLYLGGIRNGPASVPDPNDPLVNIDLTLEIAEVANLLDPSTRGAREVIGTTYQAADVVNSRGWTGFDWDDRFGLLASFDWDGPTGPNGEPGLHLAQRPTPASPNATLTLSSPFFARSGPAFDNGFDGSGFPLADATNGPAAAVPEQLRGAAFGLDPTTFAIADDIYGPDFGSPTSPTSPLYTFFTPATGTIWRDFDIHPTNGFVVARGNNSVVLAERNASGPNPNGTQNIFSITPPGGPALQVAQNVEILHNTACGTEAIVINDRAVSTAVGQFSSNVLFYDLAGNQLTYEVRLPDGTLAPIDGLPTDNNIYSFFWDEASQTLFVGDGVNNVVWVLTLTCPCEVDLDQSGEADFFDLAEYLTLLAAGDPGADFNNSGATDSQDVTDFLTALSAGCP